MGGLFLEKVSPRQMRNTKRCVFKVQAVTDCYTQTTTSSTPVKPLSSRMLFKVNMSDYDPNELIYVYSQKGK